MRLKKRVFSVRLSRTDFEYLDNISDYLGLNRSNTIRMLVHNYFKRKTFINNDNNKPRY